MSVARCYRFAACFRDRWAGPVALKPAHPAERFDQSSSGIVVKVRCGAAISLQPPVDLHFDLLWVKRERFG